MSSLLDKTDELPLTNSQTNATLPLSNVLSSSNVNTTSSIWSKEQLLGSCGVPLTVQCFCTNTSGLVGGNVDFSEVSVFCVSNGCYYSGPIHQKCLKRWDICLDLQCQLLLSSLAKNNDMADGSEKHKIVLENLFRLFECRWCSQYTLCRPCTKGESSDILDKVTEDIYCKMLSTLDLTKEVCENSYKTDPYQSVLNTIQFINDMNQTEHASSQPINVYSNDSPDSPAYLDNVNVVNTRSMSYNHPPTSRMMMMMNESFSRRFSLNQEPSSGPTKSHILSMLSNQSSGYYSGQSLHDASDLCGSNSSSSSRTPSFAERSLAHCDTPKSFPRRSSMNDKSPGLNSIRENSIFQFDNALVTKNTQSRISPKHFESSNFDLGSKSTPNSTSTVSSNVDSNSRTSTSKRSLGFGAKKASNLWPTNDDLLTKSKSNTWNADGSQNRRFINPKGNIFDQRLSFNVFLKLPQHKQNPYFIQIDDDSCTGNEDTRTFLLSQLTNHRVSEVYCLGCQTMLKIYDHFPVIDGLFFMSPLCHRSSEGARKGGGLRVSWHTNGILNQSNQAGKYIFNSSSSNMTNINNYVNLTTQQPEENNCADNRPSDELAIDPEAMEKSTQKLLAPTKLIVPPPGCLGPRQQLNIEHLNNLNSSMSTSRHTGAARQGRFLHALCIRCINGFNNPAEELCQTIVCIYCSKPWSSSSLLVGGLYTYDIFAANPCCASHLTCGSCQARLDYLPNQAEAKPSTSIDDHQIRVYPLNYFSQYSNLIKCAYCSKTDYHFVKLFEDYYKLFIPTD